MTCDVALGALGHPLDLVVVRCRIVGPTRIHVRGATVEDTVFRGRGHRARAPLCEQGGARVKASTRRRLTATALLTREGKVLFCYCNVYFI